MGINLADVGKLCAGTDKQTVVDLEPRAADDGKFVLEHQVVDLVDRACRAVFQRNDAVLAKTLLDCREDRLKVREIQNVRRLEELFAGNLRVCALHTLAGDHRFGREEIGGLLDGSGDFFGKLRVVAEQPVLVRAAQ